MTVGDIRIGRNSVPMYLAQVSSETNIGDPEAPATPAAVAGNTSNATIGISGISPAQIPTLKSVVRRDIELLDDMMLAEQLLTIRYMLEVINRGDLSKTRIDEDAVPQESLAALKEKYPRAGQKVGEKAVEQGGTGLTKGAFAAAKDYYFGKVYIRLDKASPQDILERLLSLTGNKFSTSSGDVDFEKKHVEFLVNCYNNPRISAYKDVVLKMMVLEEAMLVRHMLEIINAGNLGRGWRDEEIVNAASLDQITCSRVSQKIREKAGTAPLTKKAFGDAKSDYFKLMMKMENVIKNVNLGDDVIGKSEKLLDFTGIPMQGLKNILEADNLKLLLSLNLGSVPDKPIEVLTAAGTQGTAFEEQYAKGMIILSKWLKTVEDQLSITQPAPEPEKLEEGTEYIPLPPEKTKVPSAEKFSLLGAKFTAIPEWTYKGLDLRGDLDLSFPYPYLGVSAHVGRFSFGGELGVGTPALFDRLELKAGYGITREQNIIDKDFIDPQDIQTASISARIKMGESVSLRVNSSSRWQYRNKLEKAASGLEAGIGYVSSSFYAEGGGRVVFNHKTPSYPSLEQLAYIEGGPKGFGPKWLNKLGLRLSYYGRERFGGGVVLNGIISAGASAAKSAKSEKTIDSSKPMTAAQAEQDGLLQLLVSDTAGLAGSEKEEKFSQGALDHHVYMALALLGKDAMPGLGMTMLNNIVFAGWIRGLKAIAEKDSDNILKGVKNVELELPKYICMKDFLNAEDWEVVKKGGAIQDDKYRGVLTRYAAWLGMEFIVPGANNSFRALLPSHMRKILNNAWTENIGSSKASGLMSEKVLVFGAGAGQIKVNDNTYKNLKGEIKIHYDGSTKTGTLISKENTNKGSAGQ